ncbi:PREDICTED: Werner Syndrome-like exonuclease [Nelumbo nucifera]|uniref:Werner Syndrome-like exonuclease n=1 Tax=Nelumbo nucifera TaxID=4432 RepID=A0A1U8B267_NELNU|nr:PREDICTED: Werner Syndrome-like exonuclease [Nelumbo nucifera]
MSQDPWLEDIPAEPSPTWNTWSISPSQAGQGSAHQPSLTSPTTSTPTMNISIEDLECHSNDHQTYLVTFFNDQIHTTLTHVPSTVEGWITDVQRTHQANLTHFIVGLDVEWRPSFNRTIENKVAILQLCVDRKCLIFQLLYADHIPMSLIDFLNNPNFSFVGVGINEDVEKLLEDYEINVSNTVDLRGLAVKKLGKPELKNSGLKDLTREVLGKEMEKPRRVTMSRWDTEWLSYDQVQYACLDAFLSSEIGRNLILKN